MPIVAGLIGSKIAVAALAIAALGGGGAAVAAAAGALPTPGHSQTGAPTAEPTASSDPEAPTQTPEPTDASGPDASGPAAYGLCTAYLAGGLASGSTAYDSLTATAGDAGVDAYCELIVANVHPKPTDHGRSGDHGKPDTAGAHAPELPAQSQNGISHRPSEKHGR